MTPLEAMAKARWEAAALRTFGRDVREGNGSWAALGQKARDGNIADMRAALLALAEAELPEEALKCSLGISSHTKQEMFESRMDLRPMIFRAVCRAIAESGS